MKIICNAPPKLIKSDTKPPCIKHTVWFDKQTKKLYYCDGKEWVEVSVCDFKVKQFVKPKPPNSGPVDLCSLLCTAENCIEPYEAQELEAYKTDDILCQKFPVYYVTDTQEITITQESSNATLQVVPIKGLLYLTYKPSEGNGIQISIKSASSQPAYFTVLKLCSAKLSNELSDVIKVLHGTNVMQQLHHWEEPFYGTSIVL